MAEKGFETDYRELERQIEAVARKANKARDIEALRVCVYDLANLLIAVCERQE